MTKSILPLLHQTFSVLPDNRSPLERAIELSLSHQLFSIELPQPFLFDAEQVPEYLLPYLASENLVTDWSSDDALNVRRLTTKSQPLVYQKAGTVAGIRGALESFGGDVDIEKWYQYGGEPYHLQAIFWFDGVFDEAFYPRLSSRIQQAKSERDVVELTLGVKSSDARYYAQSVQVIYEISTVIFEPTLEPVTTNKYYSSTVQIVMDIEGIPYNDNN